MIVRLSELEDGGASLLSDPTSWLFEIMHDGRFSQSVMIGQSENPILYIKDAVDRSCRGETKLFLIHKGTYNSSIFLVDALPNT